MIMNRYFADALVVAAICFALPQLGFADDAGPQLAAKLRAKETGSTLVRIRMVDGKGQTLQVQIKSRVSGSTADVVYQILFPKERKGESVLLHRSGNKFSATLFTPPNTIKQIVELSQAELAQTSAEIGNTNARYDYQQSLAAIRYQTGQ